MAKISPVSIKYMIHASFTVEGALEKPDIIGAVFGQTEGLLGADLEMRELQKEGKIGRIEVELERKDKRTFGTIKIPTALDKSETTLIAAAVETIERIGPCDAQIEIERIEDVRSSKRDYIIQRAKKLITEIEGSTDSREISNTIKDSARIASVQEYGENKLPAGDLSGNEIIVVEGRADVLNLMRNGVNNVIAMNGTKLPNEIKALSNEKEITLFIDGDRGGRLIAQNVVDNAKIKYIASAPDGKEVEELTGKEVLMNLRKKVSAEEFFSKDKLLKNSQKEEPEKPAEVKEIELTPENKAKLKEILDKNQGTGKAVVLNESFEEIKNGSARGLGNLLRKLDSKPYAIVIDGTVTSSIINYAEEAACQIIVARNFTTTDTKIKLLSL
jgi:DNA primase